MIVKLFHVVVCLNFTIAEFSFAEFAELSYNELCHYAELNFADLISAELNKRILIAYSSNILTGYHSYWVTLLPGKNVTRVTLG